MKKIKFFVIAILIMISTKSLFAQTVTFTYADSNWWPITVTATFVKNTAPFTHSSQYMTFTSLNSPQTLSTPLFYSLYSLEVTTNSGAYAAFGTSDLSSTTTVQTFFQSPFNSCAVSLNKDGDGNFLMSIGCLVGG